MDIPNVMPILLSWAVFLSDYPAPDEVPTLLFKPHEFFVQRVCAGRKCNATVPAGTGGLSVLRMI